MGLDEALQFRDKAIEYPALVFVRDWIARVQADNCFFQVSEAKQKQTDFNKNKKKKKI